MDSWNLIVELRSCKLNLKLTGILGNLCSSLNKLNDTQKSVFFDT